jgi:hypothetical protein
MLEALYISELTLGILQLCWVLASRGCVSFYIMPVKGAGALRLACV